MRVALATAGGFAAALRLGRPPLEVDDAELPPAAAGELAALVAAVRAEEPVPDPGRSRDAVTATLTLTDAGTTTVLRRSDAASTPAWEELVGWVRGHGAVRP
jgi:hypothetical protein